MNPTTAKAPIRYLKSSNFLRTWSEGQCEVCALEGVRLSSARLAPPVAHYGVRAVPARTTREAPPRQRKEVGPYLNTFNAAFKAADKISAFSAWLKSPTPSTSAPQVKKALAPPVKKVPPFDIQDVPNAMRKVGMPIAAKLQERWFAGAANYSRSDQDLRDEINQNGKRYASAMVDTTTIKLKWVRSFSRAEKAFDELIGESLGSPEALKILKSKLMPYRHRQDIRSWSAANSNLLEFHQKFQFQYIPVNASWGARIAQFLERSFNADGVPDDLTGALGTFNFYAAVRYARFADAGRTAFVDEVSVYVRDPYAFTDEQYLGHWSASHVAVVPAHQVAGGWLNYPVVDVSVYDKDNVLYPVTNKDYRDWRKQHGQGGDFMIYTDRRTVRLDSPIRVAF
ncbi:MAG: hypothetical protein H7293_18135 [Candidatus Saccharibacteria bacterium]|nr:hypothetical protein [Rhodoferax sp.]